MKHLPRTTQLSLVTGSKEQIYCFPHKRNTCHGQRNWPELRAEGIKSTPHNEPPAMRGKRTCTGWSHSRSLPTLRVWRLRPALHWSHTTPLHSRCDRWCTAGNCSTVSRFFFTDHLDKNKEGVCKNFFSFLRSQWFLESKNFAAHAPCARSEIRRFLKLEFWRKIYLIGSIVPVFENSNNYNITPP